MIERFLNKKISWELNDLQFRTKEDLQAAIENGNLDLCERDDCLCGSHNKKIFASIDRFGLEFSSYICKNCGLIFTTPYISDNSLPFYYNNFYHPLHFGKAKPIENLCLKGQGAKIFNFVKAHLNSSYIKIFEIGAGCGSNLLEFANIAKKNKIEVDCYGTEYNKDYVKHGNKNKGLKLTSNSIEEYVNQTNDKFNLVIMSHVFEHLTDPLDTLEHIKKIMHENSIIYIEVPGILDLKTKYAYDCDFLKYITHAHTFNFSLSSLTATLNQCGFHVLKGNEKVESLFGFNKYTNNSFTLGLYDNYKAILSYLSDLEANLAFYQSKNPANLMYGKFKRKIKSFAKKFQGKP